jgi:hypothetical protein
MVHRKYDKLKHRLFMLESKIESFQIFLWVFITITLQINFRIGGDKPKSHISYQCRTNATKCYGYVRSVFKR